MTRRKKIGDVYELKVEKGFAYLQYTHEYTKPPNWGSLIRGLDGFYEKRPTIKELKSLVNKQHQFQTFCFLQQGIKTGEVLFIENFSVPEIAQKFPVFKGSNSSQKKDPSEKIWWLWDVLVGCGCEKEEPEEHPCLDCCGCEDEEESQQLVTTPPQEVRMVRGDNNEVSEPLSDILAITYNTFPQIQDNSVSSEQHQQLVTTPPQEVRMDRGDNNEVSEFLSDILAITYNTSPHIQGNSVSSEK